MLSERIELSGHIIDSLTLPKVLDEIVRLHGDYSLDEFEVGKTRELPSYVRLTVKAERAADMADILARVKKLGAVVLDEHEPETKPAPADGVFPPHFYATTNLPTYVRLDGDWIPVESVEMDVGIVLDRPGRRAWCVPMHRVKAGQPVVVGDAGVKVVMPDLPRQAAGFEFMSSRVSTEKPKALMIAETARRIRETHAAGKKVLMVGGPAIIHTGAGAYLEKMLAEGHIDILFAGNALAAHDIENSLYGTSLGVYLHKGQPAEEGHTHHLWAINAVRAAGGIRQAVEAGLIKSGVMHTCVTRNIPYVLAGSIRDDGPLPDVITDTVKAADEMRRHIPEVGLALLVATTLHSIAVGNLLPAGVHTVCVDMNAATVTKLADRGTWQAIGLVTDAEVFLRELAAALGA
jgi:lysine-ketoglutarate reductase/saccharopine dehydrogenase-like protein (TIGR00300 family)